MQYPPDLAASRLSNLIAASLFAAFFLILSSVRCCAGHYTADYSGGTCSYFGTTYDGDTVFGTLPYQTLADGSWGNGYGFGIGDAFGMNISCNGSITATLHWVPDYPGEPHPPQVIVKETCGASWFGESRASVTGSCNNALGFPEVDNINPPDSSGSSSGTLYTLMAGADTLPLPARSPSASASESVGDLEVSVSYSAGAEPLEVNLEGGIGPKDAKRFLIGQQVTASVATGGLTADSYDWCIGGGSAFKDYTANNTNGTFTGLSIESDPTCVFHFARPAPNVTVVCTVHLVVPAGAKPEDGIVAVPTRTCSSEAPTFAMDDPVYGTTTAVLSNDIPYMVFYNGPNTNGAAWTGKVANPQGFGQSQWGFVQLITPKTNVTSSGLGFRAKNNNSKGLDNSFPIYGKTFPTDGMYYPSGDTPFLRLESAWTSASVNHSFESWMMFLPPGAGSVWVPLYGWTWNWSGSMSRPNINSPWGNLTNNTSHTDKAAFPAHPTWERLIVPPSWPDDYELGS